jgi:hypothetical protein
MIGDLMNLSNFAWAALDQLRRSDVWDGDLISKTGRSELIDNGLAERKGSGMNGLTHPGRVLAAKMSADDWHTGKRN